MATPATNHLASPSTLGIPNSNDNVRVLTPSPPVSPGKPLPPSPRAHSKSLLTIALQKAQSAVLLDSANSVDEALAAYKQTVKLLLQVIEKAVNEADRRRLQHIHDTYADRIRLLSTIIPNDESEDNDEDEQQQHRDDDFSTEENETKTFTHRRGYSSTESNGGSSSSQINSIVAGSNVREIEDGISASDAEEQGSKQVNAGNKFGEGEDATFSNIDKTPKDEEDADISSANDDVINNTTYHSYQKREISDRNKNDRESTKSAHSERRKHKSNPSTSSIKSLSSSRKSRTFDRTTPPVSDYESVTERRKSATESTEIAELPTSSDDIGPYATNDLDNPDSREEVSQFDPNLTAEDEGSLATSTVSLEEKTPRTSLTSSHSQPDNSEISNSVSSLNSQTFSSSRPPSKSTDKKHKRKGSSSVSHIPKSSISSITSTSSTSTIQKPSARLSHEHDDDSSTISPHTSVSTSSATISSITGPTPSAIPVDQIPVEKMAVKAPSHSKQPSLTSIQQNDYDSRKTSAALSPSNPSVLADTPPATGSNGNITPRRAASSPGQRKNNNIRPLQNDSPTGLPGWNHTPGSPNSPWISGGFNSPTSASPVFSPGIHRSDSVSAKFYDASYSSMVDTNSLMFGDDTLNDLGQQGIPEPLPTDVHLRPFWLMRMLERTMTTGGYLTKKLFVPNNMWVQANVKLVAVEAKLSSCDAIHNCLLRLEKTTVDDLDGLAKELDSIELHFDGIQNTLARKLNYVETTSGKSRQSTSLMSWGSKLSQRLDRMGMGNVANRSEEANSYVEVLLKVFQAAYVVEGYIRHFSSLKTPYHHHHTHIVSRLYKMADFFGNVVCRFVVRDLGILADKYVKRGGSWVID